MSATEPKPPTPEQAEAISKLTNALGVLVGTAINFALDHYLTDRAEIVKKPCGLPFVASFGACDLASLVAAADRVAQAAEEAAAKGFHCFLMPMDSVTAAFLSAVWMPDRRAQGGREIVLAALACSLFGPKPTSRYAQISVKPN